VSEPAPGPDDDKSWLRVPLTDSTAIASRYDEWASTYERDLVVNWDYNAPFEAARLLVDRGAVSPVLDIGCGIGLTGRALAGAGFHDIDGVDLSEVSMAAARESGAYRSLVRHDFNASALPFEDRTYATAVCVGVLSYAAQPGPFVADMCRVVTANGTILFTHRTDLWDEQKFPQVLHSLLSEGRLLDVIWSEPRPYMPGNEDFADRILVRYVTATVA